MTEELSAPPPLPDLGAAAAVEEAAFKLPVGATSDPIATDNGTTIFKVLEKKEITPAEMGTAKDKFREELVSDRRNRFFSAYMAKAKQRMRIEVNRETVQRVVG